MKCDIPALQAVESPCLSILVPLLVKGLREKAAVVRKTAVIIDNMVKVQLMTLLYPQHRPQLRHALLFKG